MESLINYKNKHLYNNTRLNLLPDDILMHIGNILISNHQQINKIKFDNVLNELKDLWLWSLWRVNIYIATDNMYNILPKDSIRKKNLIQYLQSQETVKFCNPRYILKINEIKEIYYQQ